jgi:hypothetical protein
MNLFISASSFSFLGLSRIVGEFDIARLPIPLAISRPKFFINKKQIVGIGIWKFLAIHQARL